MRPPPDLPPRLRPRTFDRLRPWLLAPLLLTAIWSLLASSTFEEGEPDPRAEVSYALSTITGNLVADDGAIRTAAGNLRVAGEYEADAGRDLSVNRDDLSLDTTTNLAVDMAALSGEDDDLAAIAALDVTSPLRLDFGGDPRVGQLSVVEGGTTTLITVQTDPDGVDLERGTEAAAFLSWDDFRDARRDTDETQSVRVASIAFEQLEVVLQLARIAEDLVEEIEANKNMLESMNLGQPLSVECDNPGAGERVLVWRQDAPGSGEGSIGAGDGFETSFENCLDNTLQRFLKGTIALNDYLPVEDPDRSLGGDFSYAALFLSEEETSLSTVPSATSPRINGTLRLRYDERVLEEMPPEQ